VGTKLQLRRKSVALGNARQLRAYLLVDRYLVALLSKAHVEVVMSRSTCGVPCGLAAGSVALHEDLLSDIQIGLHLGAKRSC
jgi:hypothetical protein